MNLLTLEVFEQDGFTSIATIPRRTGVSFLHELNGDGSGRVTVHLDDAILAANPTLLSPRNVVKVAIGAGSPVFAWVMGKPTKTTLSSDENAGRVANCQGAGVRTILAEAVVYPENQGVGQPYDLRDTFSENRPTDYSSYIGSWKINADWATPLGVTQSTDTTGTRGGSGGDYPTSWVDGAAKWIWSTDPTLTAAVEINYFRHDFNLASDTTIGVWASGDNRILSLRLDGEEIAADDPQELYGWKKTYATQPVTLAAGNHTLAAAVENRSGPGGFLCTYGTLTAAGELDTVIGRTDTTAPHWQVHTGTPLPGWTAGQIMRAFLREAWARSEIYSLDYSFSILSDTDAVPWPAARINRTWRVGTDLLDVLNQLIAEGYDADVGPDLYVNMWNLAGTDRTATVTLGDLLSHEPSEDTSVIRNSVLVRYHDRSWTLVEDAASIALYGPKSTSITAGSADSLDQATKAGEQVLRELALPQRVITVTFTSEQGPQPYTDFFLGDRITAPDEDGSPAELRVMSIAAEEQENYIMWTVQLYPENP